MRRRRAQSRLVSRSFAVFALSCCVNLCAVSVQAQDEARTSTDPAGYSALIDEALSEHAAGNFEEARTLFAKAHAIFPNARTLRGMGMMEFELRDYAASSSHLEQALASQIRALNGELRDSTTKLLARAQTFVGRIALTVEPAGARVLLDGAELSLEDGHPLVLNLGEHTLDVRAEGFTRETRTITVRGGEAQALRVALASLDGGSDSVGVADEGAAGERASTGPGALPWVLVGGGGALIVGGVVLLALARSDIDQVENPGDDARWEPDSADAYDAAPVKSGVGIALLGVGAAGAAVGLVWALGGSDERSARATSLRVAVAPQRIAVRGSF